MTSTNATEGVVDLMDLMRRIAIADGPTKKHVLRAFDLSPPPDDPPTTLAMSLVADVALTLGTLRPDPRLIESLPRIHRRLFGLSDVLPALPRGDAPAVAMIDDFVLRTIEDKRPETASIVLRSLGLPERLPFLDDVSAMVSDRYGAPRGPVVLLACQHLMGSIIPQFRHLHRLGVEYGNMFVLGKPYSANRAVVLSMASLGIRVSESSLLFPETAAKNASGYETFMKHAARDLATEALARVNALGSDATLLVIDDGGLLIENVHRLIANSQPPRVAGVEQTTGGLLKLSRLTLKWPVVNVAASFVKLRLESPFIAHSIIEELEGRLQRLRGESLASLTVAVIGFGAVGTWVSRLLEARGARVAIFDTDNKKMASAGIHYNAPTSLRDALRSADAVIGCTGKRWLDWKKSQAYLKPDTILASASSADIEFRGMRGRSRSVYRWPWSKNFEDDSDFQRAHNDYRVTGDLGDVWLTNAGFPVNFTGGIDPIDPQIIQLTRALMYAGSAQALNTPSRKKLVAFDGKLGKALSAHARDTIFRDHLDSIS